MNIITILILGGIVYYAMTNKSKNTRNVLLLVAGLLFFCMMNKEGFTLPVDRATPIQSPANTGPTYTFSGDGEWTRPEGANAAGAEGNSAVGVAWVGTEAGKVGPWKVKWADGIVDYGDAAFSADSDAALDGTNISTIWGCEGVAEVDCAGNWSPCTAACETAARRNWMVGGVVVPTGAGSDCPPASPCSVGDGTCVDVSGDGDDTGACSGAPNRTPDHDDCEWDWWGLASDLDDSKVCDKGTVMDSKCKEEE